MAVWPAVTAGAMSSATVGEISAIFLVVTTIKSNWVSDFETSGIALHTSAISRYLGVFFNGRTVGWSPAFYLTEVNRVNEETILLYSIVV
jgi:hypothetical protein